MTASRSTTITIATALAALVGVATGWGFSVDDALISTRVAHHLASGAGYRFNLDGDVVDCVTPLGWAPLLIPVSLDGAWPGLRGASLIGAGAWLAAAAWLGRQLAAETRGWAWLSATLALGVNLPLGAWASAGMETGLVMALSCGALSSGWGGALCAGAAAALRPELVPWAVVLTLGLAVARGRSLGERTTRLGLALGPALLVAGLRGATFGHPAPLSVFVKPSTVEHGLHYAFGALVLSGPGWLLLGPRALGRLERRHAAIGAAIAVHVLTLIGVGGDWMPLWRLAVPVFPGLLVLGAAVADRSRYVPRLARAAGVLGCAALLHLRLGGDVRAVKATRARISRELPALLTDVRRVATLDVGWVGASSSALHVIDLAGLTDPEVAYLPGGHTTKRLPDDFLERRNVEALVLLMAPGETSHGDDERSGDPRRIHYARGVEARVMRLDAADAFRIVGELRLSNEQSYVVLRRRQPGSEGA